MSYEFIGIFRNCMEVIDMHPRCKINYLNFQKAILKVPRKRLMLKIKSLGIAENVLLYWIEDWFEDREQIGKVRVTYYI
jgi:hypothetical protein